jgi:hypothetical protein
MLHSHRDLNFIAIIQARMLAHTVLSRCDFKLRHCHRWSGVQGSGFPYSFQSSPGRAQSVPFYVSTMESAASLSFHHLRAAGRLPLRASTGRHWSYLRCNCSIPSDLPSLPALRRIMFSIFFSVAAIVLAISLSRPIRVVYARCRNQPGDPGYPTAADWSALNHTIGGRLLRVVPSVEACRELGCTEAQWASGIFRQTIPGAMNAVSTVFPLDPVYHR